MAYINKFFDSTPSIGKPTTVPDELVADMLEFLCGFEPDKRRQVQKQYNTQKQVELRHTTTTNTHIMNTITHIYKTDNTHRFNLY